MCMLSYCASRCSQYQVIPEYKAFARVLCPLPLADGRRLICCAMLLHCSMPGRLLPLTGCVGFSSRRWCPACSTSIDLRYLSPGGLQALLGFSLAKSADDSIVLHDCIVQSFSSVNMIVYSAGCWGYRESLIVACILVIKIELVEIRPCWSLYFYT